MGKRLIQTQTVYFPGTDEAAADPADKIVVTLSPTSVAFVIEGGFSPSVYDASELASLLAKGQLLIDGFNADGNGGRLEVNPADDSKTIELDEDAGRIVVTQGASATSTPIEVWEELAADQA
jgi:hypothetical protein